MKNKVGVLILLFAFAIPQIASAAWWNPMSWGWVERVFNLNSKERQEQILETATTTEEDKFEQLNRKIEELEKKLSEEKGQPETKSSAPAIKASVSAQTTITPSVTTKTNSSRLSNQEIISLVKPAVVYISTEAGSGSGFIFDSAGYILTNAHVVKGFSSVEVKLSSNKKLSANVIGINDLSSDVAVLKLDSGVFFPSIKLGNSAGALQGEEVFAFGFPLGIEGDVSFKEGTVSRKIKEGSISYIEMSAEVYHGNSGGPLINNNGAVIGIITRLSGYGNEPGEAGEDVKWAIEIDYIKNELSNLKAGMQLLKSKSHTESESMFRSRLTGLNTKISDDPEISKAISSAYNESSFAYDEKQILAGVDNANESQENLRKGYLISISSGYKKIVLGLEVFKNLIKSFDDFYSSNQTGLNSIGNNFARNKLIEFDNYSTSKTVEYDKKIGEIYSKISAIDEVVKNGNLKDLPTSYFIQQRDIFKTNINYFSTQRDDFVSRLWIKALF